MFIQMLNLNLRDKTLESVRRVMPPRPVRGWIREIRETLGMTTRQLAHRIGIAQKTLVDLEHSEANDAITLRSLRRAAEAMDCVLAYALVPKSTLEKTVRAQAERLAAARLQPVEHSMALEAQELSGENRASHRAVLAEELLRGPFRRLWVS